MLENLWSQLVMLMVLLSSAHLLVCDLILYFWKFAGPAFVSALCLSTAPACFLHLCFMSQQTCEMATALLAKVVHLGRADGGVSGSWQKRAAVAAAPAGACAGGISPSSAS